MAAILRATVLAEVMARPGCDHTREEITRLRAEMVEERAHLAARVERLGDDIRHLEGRLPPGTAPVLRAETGLQPEELEVGNPRPASGAVSAGHRADDLVGAAAASRDAHPP
jgi:hypothetical protein